MKYELDAAFNAALTPKERNLLIRFCVNKGTRAKCSTKSLYRPLRQKDLRMAFEERDRASLSRIAEYERRMQDYDPNAPSDELLAMFGSVPTKENFASYCKSLISQEKEAMRELRRCYSVHVDYGYTSRFWMEFHRSLCPHVTFGDSNELHEKCDFWLEEEECEAFLHSSLLDPPAGRNDWAHDWGNVILGNMELIYEDLTVYYREDCILETVSHEQMMVVRLNDGDLKPIEEKGGGKKLAAKIRAAVQNTN